MSEQKMREALSALSFDRSDVWDTVVSELSRFVEQETSNAIDQSVTGETRIHQCGRAAALSDFNDHLLSLRDLALAQRL